VPNSYFQGKNILVTGAGRGLGKRFAIGFAKLGARVGLLARSKAEIDAAHLEIEHSGGNALRLRADVCDVEQLSTAVDRMRVHYGDLDAVICAAGILGPIGPFLSSSARAWNDAIHTNLLGVSNTCRIVLPKMVERRSGKIVALIGPGAESSRPNFSAYAAAKTGLARLIEVLGEELRDSNVQVNCVSPGSTYTAMTDEILRAADVVSSKEREAASSARLNGGTPPELQMELMQFLLSDSSNHVSGKMVFVQDDWKRLAQTASSGGLYTLRRVVKA
jgi:NAD(P)-dependent dehydrogenase (short-subunit alcohol dehydrogenase family)